MTKNFIDLSIEEKKKISLKYDDQFCELIQHLNSII